MGGIPEGILAEFVKVREATGIAISRQMKMREAGYKIVKICEGDINND